MLIAAAPTAHREVACAATWDQGGGGRFAFKFGFDDELGNIINLVFSDLY